MRIDVTNLSKIIRGSVILDNISIHFESGHIYGIIGKNGSGKTMDNDASLPSTPLIVIVSPKAITFGSVSISAISDARSYWAFAHA